jgi:SAM-dependent methyltransferase
MFDIVKDYTRAWDHRVGRISAHLEVDQDHLFDIYKRHITDMIDLTNWSMLDFGCGGGWLAKYLLINKFLIKEYIAFDISVRSIEFAKNNLKEFQNVKFIQIIPNQIPIDIVTDIFITLSVMQHFPTQEYLDYFLDYLNNSNFKFLILQIRTDKKMMFQKETYKTTKMIGGANTITDKYIAKKLTTYVYMDASEIEYPRYQYLYFQKIGNEENFLWD